MFELIIHATGLNRLSSSSLIYSYQCISNISNIGKDVWIQYYKNKKIINEKFTIGDSINKMGAVSMIMLYVETDNEDSEDKKYDVDRYKGNLEIDRRTVNNMNHDILLNLKSVISDLKDFLKLK